MKFFNYFPIENDILNTFKTIDWGNLLESDLYSLYTPSQYDNLMSISFKYYQNIDDWWIIYFFNKMTDNTFAILPISTVNGTIEYYISLMKNYADLDAKEKLKIKECIINFFIYQGQDYRTAIKSAIENLNNILYRTDPITVSEVKDFLFMHIMTDTTYSDPIKIPSLQVVYRMKAIMNQLEIDWTAN